MTERIADPGGSRAAGSLAVSGGTSGGGTGNEPLSFQSLAALLSRLIGAATADTLDIGVETCLEQLGRFTGCDLAFATLIDDHERVSDDWHWVRPGRNAVAPRIGSPLAETFASGIELLRLGVTIVVDDLNTVELSPSERAFSAQNDMQACLLAPVRVRQTLLGLCGLMVQGRPHHWDRTCVAQVEMLAQVLVQGVSRSRDRGALAVADARARRIAEFIPDGLALVDLDGIVQWTSPSLSRMTGRRGEEMVERPAADLVHPDDRDDFTTALRAQSGEANRLAVRTRAGDEWRWSELTWRTVSEPDTDVPDEIVLSIRDEHDGYLQYQALSALTERDHLTGAANRVGLDRRLAELAARDTDILFVFCDLDGFKSINDRRGHDAGDRVLAEVARALQSTVRNQDMVARVGGDEFALVVTEPGDPAMLGDRFLDAVRGAEDGTVTASIGIAGPGPAWDDGLRRLADAAMYQAKRQGKDRYVHLRSGDGPDAPPDGTDRRHWRR